MSENLDKNSQSYDFLYESGQGTAFGQGTQSGSELICVCGTFYDPEYGQGSSPAHFACMHAEIYENNIEIKFYGEQKNLSEKKESL